ncbi:MAG UNVERIFIED_CONTAM: hypothetical protein LVQ98_07115 [Rickettsiaceae bacterium]|jgi:hypothetical protein
MELEKKIALIQSEANLAKKNILTSKELDDLVIDSAAKMIYKISGINVDKSEIKKLTQ